MNITNFPYEALIELTNEPYYIGRITINKLNNNYSAEIDIVHKESRKIFRHVDILYHQPDPTEAIRMAIQRLSTFLKTK